MPERSLENCKRREFPRPWRRGTFQIVHGLLRCQSEICKLIVNGQKVNRLWNRDDVATLAVVSETIASVTALLPQGVRPPRF